MMKRILSMLLVIVMVLSVVPMQARAAGAKITSDGELPYTVKVGDKITLSLSGVGLGDEIQWAPQDSAVVKLEEGDGDNTQCTVTGLSEGKLNIKATVNGTEVTYPLGVYVAAVKKPVINESAFTMAMNKGPKTLTYTYTKDAADTYTTTELVRWRSSDPTVATIGLTNGQLTPKGAGHTDITVFFNGQWSDPVTCTVVDNQTAVIQGNSQMVVGREQELTLVFNTDDDRPEPVDWRTSPADSALVGLTKVSGNEYKCKVKALGEGEVTVVASWGTVEETDKKAKFPLVINAVNKLSIQKDGADVTELTLTGEETANLIANLPAGESEKDVVWTVTSANNAITETHSGTAMTITGNKVGTATVTAKIAGVDDTEAETVNINVVPKAVIANKPEGKMTLYVGDTFPCELKTELMTEDGLELVSDNPNAADVKNGVVTAKAAGTDVTISLKKGDTVLDSFKLDVMSQARVELDPKNGEDLLAGVERELKAVLKDADGKELTDETILWDYDYTEAEAEAAAAAKNSTTLTGNKLVAVGSITEPFDVKLIATAKKAELGAQPARVTIHVIPRVLGIVLKYNGEVVNYENPIKLNLADEAVRLNGITITAEVTPARAEQTVTWNVTGPNISHDETTGTNVVIKPKTTLETGIVTVTATAKDGTDATAQARVEFTKTASDLRILDLVEGDTLGTNPLRGGETKRLRTNLEEDKTLTDREIEWTVTDPAGNPIQGVEIDELGTLSTVAVTAKTLIKVTAKVKANTAPPVTRYITLCPSVSSIKILLNDKYAPAKNTLAYNDSPLQLRAEVNPTDHIGTLTWKSSNTDVAEIQSDAGVMKLKLKPNGKGAALITCAATDGSGTTASITVEVVKKANDVEIVGAEELISGKNAVYTATVYADDTHAVKAANQNVVWSVEDEFGNPTNAASINSRGRLVAKTVNYGTVVKVYARSAENSEVIGDYTVTILPKKVKTFSAAYEGEEGPEYVDGTLYMNVGDSTVVFGKWYTRGIGEEDEYDCTYFSSNTGVAKIYEDGTLETLKKGSTTITLRATDEDTGYVYTTKFTVKVLNTVDHIELKMPNSSLPYLRAGYRVFTATVWSNEIETIKADNQGVTWGVYEEDEDTGDLIKTDAAYITANGLLFPRAVSENKEVVVVATSKENPSVTEELRLIIRPAKDYTVTALCENEAGEWVVPTAAVTVEAESLDTPFGTEIDVQVYESGPLSGSNLPSPTITWETSNKDIVKVIDGQMYFTGKTGKVKVTPTCLAPDGKSYRGNTVTLNIVKLVSEITVSKKYANSELYSGKSLVMYANVDKDATIRRVTWSLDSAVDSSGASVDVNKIASINTSTGLIRAKKGLTEKYTLTVRATATDGSPVDDTGTVTLFPLATRVEITNRPADDTMLVTGTADLNVVFHAGTKASPNTDGNENAVKWTSSRSSVVSVDKDGVLTARKKGTATIKATATDGSGKYATVKITVK